VITEGVLVPIDLLGLVLRKLTSCGHDHVFLVDQSRMSGPVGVARLAVSESGARCVTEAVEALLPANEVDEHNPHPPPTSGLASRRFRGSDPAEMLHRVAEYLDRANPGRMIVGLWCVPPSDGSEEGIEFDVIVEHDEDAYE
jgi:hypothetical protein